LGSSWYLFYDEKLRKVNFLFFQALRNKMLQYVNVTVYNQSECKEYYKKLSPAPYSLEHYQICSEATEDLCIVSKI